MIRHWWLVMLQTKLTIKPLADKDSTVVQRRHHFRHQLVAEQSITVEGIIQTHEPPTPGVLRKMPGKWPTSRVREQMNIFLLKNIRQGKDKCSGNINL